MPRPKGSKNKAPRKITVANNDFEALIAEKTSAKENLTVEIATLEENLANIKSDLKAKKAELKKLDTELGKLEEQKAAFDAALALSRQLRSVCSDIPSSLDILLMDSLLGGSILLNKASLSSGL